MTENKKRSIYLCGFMGCGKSTVGLMLAKKLGKRYVDLDSYITEKEKMSISQIFEKYGEKYFRQRESQALAELKSANAVIATGGGALLSDKNGEIAKTSGLVIFIDTPFDVCYNRIKGDPNRPIAYNSTKTQLEKLFDMRRPLYIQNSHDAVNGKTSPIKISEKIIEIFNSKADVENEQK